MAVFSRGRSLLLLVLILLVGGIIGSVASEVLKPYVPVLSAARSAGFQVNEVDLAGILRFHLGMTVHISVGTVLGVIVSALLFRRL